MPVVAGAIAAAAVSATSYTVAAGFAFSMGTFLANTALGIVLGYAASALTPKPKVDSGAFQDTSGGVTQTIREPLASHKIVYGETRVGGTIVFAGMTGDNQFLHLAIVLAAHEVEAIDELWFNDYAIPVDAFDGSGNVNTGRYSGKVKVKKHLGGSGQVADADMVGSITGWTTNHKLSGLAYLYVRMEYDQDVFPGGMPNITAFVRGRKIFDVRTSLTRFTMNAPLFQYDYMAHPDYGLNAAAEINETVLGATANIADEIVETDPVVLQVLNAAPATDVFTFSGDLLSLQRGDRVTIASTGDVPAGLDDSTDYYFIPYQFKDTPRGKLAASLDDAMAGMALDFTDAGTGTITITKTGEPRYHGAGVCDTDNVIEDNIKSINTAFGGRVIFTGGKWQIKAAAYEAPTLELGIGDIVEAITLRTRLQKKDKFNAVKGIYRTPLNLETPSDYPVMKSDAYAELDGEVIYSELNTPFTPRPQTSRRIAKIELLKVRQEMTIRVVCTLKALELQAGDTVMITIDRYGWNQKIFEVTSFSFVVSGQDQALCVALELRETDESIFDWTTDEESLVDPAPNTTLPNPFQVDGVTGLAFDSTLVSTVGGDTLYMITLSWDLHPNAFVISGGRYEVQYKLSSVATWSPSFFVAGDVLNLDAFTASLGEAYDVRIRAVNNLLARSNWNYLLGVIAGSSGGVTVTNNWGMFVGDAVGTTLDWGAFVSDPVGATDDWGYFQ